MRRSCTLRTAIAALLIANSGIVARAHVPPTPIRLVDVQGQPVAGAIVGTDFLEFGGRTLPFPTWTGTESRTTDERGETSLTMRGETGVYAIREDKDRPLVGAIRVTRAELGRPARIVMHPACRVRLRVECPGFRELEEKYHAELRDPNWRSEATVLLGEGGKLTHLLSISSATNELEVLLPPGRYTIQARADDTQPESRAIEVRSGHRLRSLGILELSLTPTVKAGIFRDCWRVFRSDPRSSLDGGRSDVNSRAWYRRSEWGPTPNGDASFIKDLAFSPDGKVLATTHTYNEGSGVVKLWDVRTGTLAATLTGPDGENAVHELAFAPNGAILAGSVASKHNFELSSSVMLWDTAGRQVKRTLRGHTMAITALAFSPDGHALATASGDATVRFWDVASGREIGRSEFKLEHDGPRRIAYAPDGRTLAVSHDDSLTLWEIPGYQRRSTLEPGRFYIQSLAFAPDGRTLAASGSMIGRDGEVLDGQVRLYDMTSRPPLRRATLTLDPAAPARMNVGADYFGDVVFTPDGRRIISVAGSTIGIWDASTGVEFASLVVSTGNAGHQLAVSPDGRWLAITDHHRPYVRLIGIPQPPSP